MHNFILRFETVPTWKSSRAKPQKKHIVYQHYLCKDDQKLSPRDFKIFLIDNNEGFVAPARNLCISELHSEISVCNELDRHAVKSCKEVVNMMPVNSQIHSAFVLAHKHLRAALDLWHSANVAVGAAHITVYDVGPGVSLPPGVQPKKSKSRHKTPTATVSKIPPNVVPTGLVAHEPQDQGGVAGAEGGYGAPEGEAQPQVVSEDNPDPDNLASIANEELDVADPDEESKFEYCKQILYLIQISPNNIVGLMPISCNRHYGWTHNIEFDF